MFVPSNEWTSVIHETDLTIASVDSTFTWLNRRALWWTRPSVNSTFGRLDLWWTRPLVDSTFCGLDLWWTRSSVDSTLASVDSTLTGPLLDSTFAGLVLRWTQPLLDSTSVGLDLWWTHSLFDSTFIWLNLWQIHPSVNLAPPPKKKNLNECIPFILDNSSTIIRVVLELMIFCKTDLSCLLMFFLLSTNCEREVHGFFLRDLSQINDSSSCRVWRRTRRS